METSDKTTDTTKAPQTPQRTRGLRKNVAAVSPVIPAVIPAPLVGTVGAGSGVGSGISTGTTTTILDILRQVKESGLMIDRNDTGKKDHRDLMEDDLFSFIDAGKMADYYTPSDVTGMLKPGSGFTPENIATGYFQWRANRRQFCNQLRRFIAAVEEDENRRDAEEAPLLPSLPMASTKAVETVSVNVSGLSGLSGLPAPKYPDFAEGSPEREAVSARQMALWPDGNENDAEMQMLYTLRIWTLARTDKEISRRLWAWDGLQRGAEICLEGTPQEFEDYTEEGNTNAQMVKALAPLVAGFIRDWRNLRDEQDQDESEAR